MTTVFAEIQLTEEERKSVAVKKEFIAKLPKGTVSVIDQPYVEPMFVGTKFGSTQDLDLYVPAGKGPFPVILWMHGGSWHSGNKESCGFVSFIFSGFAVASVNYRLTGDAPFPAQIEDVFSALEWIRVNSGQYNLDPDKIGVMGYSAGALLAALVVQTEVTGEFVNSSGRFPRVKAAAVWAGVSDLNRETGDWPKSSFIWNPQDTFNKTFFQGGVNDPKTAKRASPMSYVRPGLPPIIIVHGEKDEIVPQGHAISFSEALAKEGNKVSLLLEAGKGHGNISTEVTFRKTIEFFKEAFGEKK